MQVSKTAMPLMTSKTMSEQTSAFYEEGAV
jgi:hypothetical protein